MITQRKYRIVLWIAIILAICNISIIGTFAWMHYHLPPFIQDFKKERGHPGDEMRQPWFTRDLKLNNNEIQLFHQHSEAFKEQAQALAGEIQEFRFQMMNEMMSENPDTTKLNAISEQIGKNHCRLKRLTYQYFANLKSVCPADQLPLLEKSFQRFMQHQGERMPGRGKNKRNNE